MKYLYAILLLLTGCASQPIPVQKTAQAQEDTAEDVANVIRLRQQLQATGLGIPPVPPAPGGAAMVKAQSVAAVVPAPVLITNVMECTIVPVRSVVLMISTDLVNWSTNQVIDYPVEGAVIDFTNISTNLPIFYRVGVN